MKINEIKNLKIGDKIVVKGMDASMISEDRIETVLETSKDRVKLGCENGYYHYARNRELANDKWYEKKI